MAKAFQVVRPTSSHTLIEFVLDETGSMNSCRKATIDGFNEYVNGQKGGPDACTMTLSKFDSDGIRVVCTDTPIEQVVPLTFDTYTPGSMTNLYDAVGTRIRDLERRLAGKPQPNVLFVIMTDGADNMSREYTPDSLKQLIKEKEAQGWTFTFLGANQDAWEVGQTFGMAQGNTMTYSTENMSGTMATLSAATTSYRGMRAYAASAGLESVSVAARDFFSGLNKDKE